MDSYVSGEDQKPTSELPKNFLLGGIVGQKYSLGQKIGDRISSAFKQYYRGSSNAQDVQDMMNKAVSDLVEGYAQAGFYAAEITPKIIEDVYNRCRLESIGAAGEASWM